MGARIRKVGKGGLRFRRALSVDWEIEQLTPENIVGSEGTIVQSTVFGDPYSSDARGPISILGLDFPYFKNLPTVGLEASTGIVHKISDGPFFKQRDSNLPPEIKSLISLGAWTNNLPPGESLNLQVAGLTPDNVYQIRCIFADGKNKTSPSIALEPGNHVFTYDRQSGCVAVGTFTAPTEEITIKIVSMAAEPPHINAMVLRNIDINPRIVLSQLRTIAGPKP